ncbi:Insulinase (Peptidase M16) [Schaereria dolodes]|nr:Insulinase (Peptidase M16) [Schaereria dolodes]
MIAFFDHFINPASPYRAKLSVHMTAQLSTQAMASTMSTSEQKDKLTTLLTKYLTSMGISVDRELLTRRLDAIDTASGDQQAIIDAISSYLSDDAKHPIDQTKQITDQSQQLLATVLPGLGIEICPTAEAAADLPPTPPMPKTTYIENVYEFKAGLEVSRGPRPVKDLSEFEDSEPKL